MTTYIWTTPILFTVGQVVTADDMNPLFHDNMLFLNQAKYARLFHSGDQALTATVAAALAWDSETDDPYLLHDTSTNNSRVTVPSGLAGIYRIQATSLFAANVSTGTRQVELRKNGSSTPFAISSLQAITNVATIVTVESSIILGVGDYIQAWVTSSVGLNVVHGSNSTYLEALWLGSAA
jgi:hypothetical protein